MRVALVTNWYEPHVGGLESSVALLARTLRALGDDVTVITSSRRGQAATGHDRYGTPLIRSRLPLLVKKLDVEVVHVHGSDRMIIAVASACSALVRVVTPHNGLFREIVPNQVTRTKQFVDRVVLPTILRRYGAVTALTVGERDRYQRSGIQRASLAVIPNAYDDELEAFADERRASPTPGTARTFSVLGRISPEKGIATAIRAAALSGQNVTFIGTGDERFVTSMKELARALRAPVTFAGLLIGRAKFEALRSSIALVVPSDAEGQSLAILEAMRLGLLVIASAGATSGIVINGVTGLVFKTGEASDLASAMSAVAANRERFSQVSERGCEEVRKLHSPTTVAQAYRDLYRRRMTESA